jgi:hypothetical protein
MIRRFELAEVTSLLHAFDARHISEVERDCLRGLDVNRDADVWRAVQALILPRFLALPETSRIALLGTLSSALIDSREDFAVVFDQITLAFDAALQERRAFMLALYRALQKSLRAGPEGER